MLLRTLVLISATLACVTTAVESVSINDLLKDGTLSVEKMMQNDQANICLIAPDLEPNVIDNCSLLINLSSLKIDDLDGLDSHEFATLLNNLFLAIHIDDNLDALRVVYPNDTYRPIPIKTFTFHRLDSVHIDLTGNPVVNKIYARGISDLTAFFDKNSNTTIAYEGYEQYE